MTKKYDASTLQAEADIFGENKAKADKPADECTEIDVNKIRPSVINPYKVRIDDEMNELMASIKENGILSPIVVRKQGDCLEILSGHRRTYAAKAIGLSKVPVKVLDVSDEEAAVIMIDSNLSRTNITPCEKAMAYKLKYEAILKMEENHGTPGVPWERRADIAARRMGIGTTTLKRYLHIASLDEDLLTQIENGKLTVKSGEQISFLTPDVQKIIAELVEKEDIRIKESEAKMLRSVCYVKEDVTADDIRKALKDEQEEGEGNSFSFSLSPIDRNTFFPGQTDNQIEMIINSLIAEWAENTETK